MQSDFLRLPVRFKPFFEKKKLATCTLKESVARNLHLLITTAIEESKLDMEFGAQFWDHDYDIHLSNDARREIIISSLREQITKYEKRLTKSAVNVSVRQALFRKGDSVEQRRKVEIIITGLLVRNEEPFSFTTGFFIGPLSFD